MALINCPECDKEVSDKAEVCPKCGFGVAKYVERQRKILKIQEEAEEEAYLYVKQKKKEEKEKAKREKEKKEQEKKAEEDRKNNIYTEAVNKYISESSKEVKEAERLFYSISGWRDSDEYLIKCKDKISELQQQEAIREEICKRRNKKIISVIAIVGICVGLIIGSYYFFQREIVPQNIYNSAIQNIQQGDYEAAIEKLKTIMDYKDAMQQIKTASKGLIVEEKYSKALEILECIENSDDVNELIIMCENGLKYEEAIDLAESENYREAINILEDIEDFKDSADILTKYRLEADYSDAVNYTNSKNYKSAILLFENLGDYKDSKEKYRELCYQYGIEEYEKKNYEIAKKYLEEVSEDKDVVEMLNECEMQLSYADLYSKAQRSISAGDLYDALDYLKQIPSDYEDTADKIELCNKYKNVVGEWRCVGYDGADNMWITEEEACRKQDFIVKIDNNGNLSLVNYKYDYKNLEFTGTTLKWESVHNPHTLNISTGTLTYTANWAGKDWTFKQSYVHSK